MNLNASAIVTVLVEVHLTQPWPEQATVKEINDSASRQATEEIQRKLHGGGSGAVFRVLGEPTVKTVIVGGRPS